MSESAEYWKERYEAVCQMAQEDRAELQQRIEELDGLLNGANNAISTRQAHIEELEREKSILTRQVVELTELLNQNGIDPA